MKKLLILFTFLVFLGGCKQKTTVTQASLGSATSACVIGKWPNALLPLAVKMSNEFSAEAGSDIVSGLNPLERMAKVWNNPVSSTKTLITVPFAAQTASSGFTTTSEFRDSEIGIYKSYNWFSNVSSGALAITQFFGVVTSSPGLGEYIELTHADIIVNYRDYGPRLSFDTATSNEFDVPTIILHELGHLLGLCHQSSKPSIMAPYYLSSQRALQPYDQDIIRDIYVDGVISGYSANKNTNALKSPVGTEVKGIIELHADGKCKHYLNGKKTHEHNVDIKK